jgi:polysaccharide pyruvyl transferase WcaK-like protein
MASPKSQLCLFGASPGTGNQGVNALCWSTLDGIARRVTADVTVFGYGDNRSRQAVPGSAPPVHFDLRSMSAGRRWWRANHLRRAQYSAHAGLRGNAIVREIQASDAVLDVSGGDSFTDLYGMPRFNDITAPKRLALTLGTPLILLPQTYGPFAGQRNERIARDLIADATLAYARDSHSYERMQAILGKRFDPDRHRPGVDLAFGLQPRRPDVLEPALQHALDKAVSRPLIGLNISGLLANQAEAAREQFSLVCDYRELVKDLVSELLRSSDAHILLVPHVHAPPGHYESDLDACLSLFGQLEQELPAESKERLTVIRSPYDACELKWIISQTDWFCGSRMHSTIAALSTGIATCSLSYSLKTQGVFESCGAGDAACDLRDASAEQALEHALSTWRNRERVSRSIASELPHVMAQCDRQLDEIASSLRFAEAA